MAASTWTDERLDDRFDTIDARFDRLDARLEAEFGRISTGFQEVRRAIDDLRLMMFRVGGGIMVGLVGVIGAVLVSGP
jgi:hypothetical protein